jgi:DNA-binding phage protein
MTLTPIQQSEAELTKLKQRRQKLAAENETLDRDLAQAIERARLARLSMREIAEHAGVERTTLYATRRRAQQPATQPPNADAINDA